MTTFLLAMAITIAGLIATPPRLRPAFLMICGVSLLLISWAIEATP